MCVGIFDPNFGAILGPQTGIFGGIWGSIFWTNLFTFLGALLGPFWGPFWDQIGPRRGQDGPKRASKTQKSTFAKTLKTICFLRFLGSRGLPREAPEAHEGSQEAPKELQDLKNKGSKNEPEKYQFLDQFWAHFGSHSGARMGSKIGPKLVLFWGPFLDQFLLILRF